MFGAPDVFQSGFERRWGHLHQQHVRQLAWLLDAPDLLDAHAPQWQGKVAGVGAVGPDVCDWLAALERDPAPLNAALSARPRTRLGLYAEQLLAFYFRERGTLVAHGLQVHSGLADTVGEFDFLLAEGDALVHLELAVKFYLLRGDPERDGIDSLVGPNLADSLGAKMRKIVERQLVLGLHPAARAMLDAPVRRAQALVKGWLFYRGNLVPVQSALEAHHCRGFWCTHGELDTFGPLCAIVPPRLQWLAPLRSALGAADVLDTGALSARLAAQFACAAAPQLVALVRQQGDAWVECRRGFVVPDDWPARTARGSDARGC